MAYSRAAAYDRGMDLKGRDDETRLGGDGPPPGSRTVAPPMEDSDVDPVHGYIAPALRLGLATHGYRTKGDDL